MAKARPKTPLTDEDFRYLFGIGNWEHFDRSGFTLDDIRAAAATWKQSLAGVRRPWLCWNVNDDWCLVQQRLVSAVGWTPLVGFDPRVGPPPLVPGAVLIDFNQHFRLPTMWMHFPMEFIQWFCDRLAFWHADCLVRMDKMKQLAERFDALEDGVTVAIAPAESWTSVLLNKERRYWEVVGCTTQGSSRDMFDNGCGWWMCFYNHPSNSPAERAKRSKHYWDSGSGIRYWHKQLGGRVDLIPEAFVAEGHFTGINKPDYKRQSPKNHKRDLSKEIALNFDLRRCCEKLGLGALLEGPVVAPPAAMMAGRAVAATSPEAVG